MALVSDFHATASSPRVIVPYHVFEKTVGGKAESKRRVAPHAGNVFSLTALADGHSGVCNSRECCGSLAFSVAYFLSHKNSLYVSGRCHQSIFYFKVSFSPFPYTYNAFDRKFFFP